MDYLVPAWHKMLEDQSLAVPMIEFDDATSHLRILRDVSEEYGLIITDYQPHLLTKLNLFGINASKTFSTFDFLQGIESNESHAFDFRDLSWPNGAYFVNAPFHLQVMVGRELFASLTFDTRGNVIYIDYFNDNHRSSRLVIDSRGFVSREEKYDSQAKNIENIYFDLQGFWRIKHDLITGKVKINLSRLNEVSQDEYKNLNSLIEEVTINHFLPLLKEEDRLIVTVDDNSLIAPEDFTNTHRRVYFSASHFHPFNSAIQGLKMKRNTKLVTDSKSNAESIRDTLHLEKLPSVIPIFPTEFQLGHSQQTFAQQVAIFSENTEFNVLKKMVELEYQRLVKNPEGESLRIITYTPQREQEANIVLNQLKEKHKGEFLIKEELPKNENDKDLAKQKLPVLDIAIKRMASMSDVLTNLDKTRLLVDLGEENDEFLQIAAISVGVPQLRKHASELLVNGKNGLICTSMEELSKGLEYYLSSLKNWNTALIENVKFLNQYSEDNLLKLWQEVFDE